MDWMKSSARLWEYLTANSQQNWEMVGLLREIRDGLKKFEEKHSGGWQRSDGELGRPVFTSSPTGGAEQRSPTARVSERLEKTISGLWNGKSLPDKIYSNQETMNVLLRCCHPAVSKAMRYKGANLVVDPSCKDGWLTFVLHEVGRDSRLSVDFSDVLWPGSETVAHRVQHVIDGVMAAHSFAAVTKISADRATFYVLLKELYWTDEKPRLFSGIPLTENTDVPPGKVRFYTKVGTLFTGTKDVDFRELVPKLSRPENSAEANASRPWQDEMYKRDPEVTIRYSLAKENEYELRVTTFTVDISELRYSSVMKAINERLVHPVEDALQRARAQEESKSGTGSGV